MNFFGGIVQKTLGDREGTSIPKFQHKNFQFFSNCKFARFPYIHGHLSENVYNRIRENYYRDKAFIANGKWSIVDLNKAHDTLYLVRDVLGICPLYYCDDSKFFAFSNSIHFFKKLRNFKWDINAEGVARFLIFNEIDEESDTLIKGVKEVMPAQVLSVNLGTFAMHSYPYFSTNDISNKPDLHYESAVNLNRKGVVSFITRASEKKNQALLLSGGLDSSCIMAALANSNVESLKTYSMTYPGTPYDETDWASLVSAKYPSYEWNLIETSGSEFLSKVEDMHRIIEFPTFSTGTFNQYKLLEKCAQNGIYTVWDGLGADALYGGHDYDRHLLFFHYLHNFKIVSAYELLGWKGKIYKEAMSALKTAARFYSLKSGNLQKFKLRIKENLRYFNKDFLEYALVVKTESLPTRETNIKKIMDDDYFTGVRHLARFTDRLARHFGLDMHYPYSENIKLALEIKQLPLEYLFRDGRSKALLRDSFRDLIPQKIYERKDKMGMQSPNNEWIDNHKEEWIKYFEVGNDDIYDMRYIKQNFKKLWSIKNQPENYRTFKHISFAIWRYVYDLK